MSFCFSSKFYNLWLHHNKAFVKGGFSSTRDYSLQHPTKMKVCLCLSRFSTLDPDPNKNVCIHYQSANKFRYLRAKNLKIKDHPVMASANKCPKGEPVSEGEFDENKTCLRGRTHIQMFTRLSQIFQKPILNSIEMVSCPEMKWQLTLEGRLQREYILL